MEIKSDDSIGVSSVYEIRDQFFDQEQTKDDSKLRILTESIFQIKDIDPKFNKLIIKDIGEIKENYNLIENYVGCYRMYAISFIDEFSNPVIKCFRRFSHFDLFLIKIKMSFPYLIIPQSPQKNPLTKIRLVEEHYFEEREKKLQFIINYLNENETFSTSKDFQKLINEFEFDFAYFSKIATFNIDILFPVSNKIKREKESSYLGFFNKLL